MWLIGSPTIGVNARYSEFASTRSKEIPFYPSYFPSYKNYLSYGQLSSFDDLPKRQGSW